MPEFCGAGDDGTTPAWLKVVLSVIRNSTEVEATQTQHLWAVIVAHSDLFYPWRNLLAEWLVKSIGRVLGQVNPQVSQCTRRVSV